jgi:hypothetical protein
VRPQFKAAIAIIDAEQFSANKGFTTHHDRSLSREEHHSHGVGRTWDWKRVGMHYINKYAIQRRQPSGSRPIPGWFGKFALNNRTQALRPDLFDYSGDAVMGGGHELRF